MGLQVLFSVRPFSVGLFSAGLCLARRSTRIGLTPNCLSKLWLGMEPNEEVRRYLLDGVPIDIKTILEDHFTQLSVIIARLRQK